MAEAARKKGEKGQKDRGGWRNRARRGYPEGWQFTLEKASFRSRSPYAILVSLKIIFHPFPFPLPLSLPFPFSIIPAHLDGTLSSPLSPSSTRVSYHFADSLSLFLSLKRERGRGLHTRDGLNCTINCTLRARYATVSSAMDRPWPRYRSSPPSCSNGGSPFLRFSFPWYISSWLMRGIRWFRWFQVIG